MKLGKRSDEVGFEPTISLILTSIFKIDAFNHSAIHPKIRVAGLEPAVFYSQSKHVNHLRYTLKFSKLIKWIKLKTPSLMQIKLLLLLTQILR